MVHAGPKLPVSTVLAQATFEPSAEFWQGLLLDVAPSEEAKAGLVAIINTYMANEQAERSAASVRVAKDKADQLHACAGALMNALGDRGSTDRDIGVADYVEGLMDRYLDGRQIMIFRREPNGSLTQERRLTVTALWELVGDLMGAAQQARAELERLDDRQAFRDGEARRHYVGELAAWYESVTNKRATARGDYQHTDFTRFYQSVGFGVHVNESSFFSAISKDLAQWRRSRS